jgi:hypothetical protein
MSRRFGGQPPSTLQGPPGVRGAASWNQGRWKRADGEAFSSALPSLRRYGLRWVGAASSGDGATSPWRIDGSEMAGPRSGRRA